MSGQAGRYQRSAAGMVGALVILLAVILGFVLLRDLNRDTPENPVSPVDYEQSLASAREQADFRVLAPQRLPDGWKATSVDFVPEPGRWHLGVLTDAGRYVGLEQAPGSERSMVRTYVDPEASRAGTVTIDGEVWRVWSDDRGDTALVRPRGDATTLVVGTVSQDALVAYVRRLR